MQFVYYYKSSDGMRHDGEMEAPDREEVFIALRRQGIRPIKVMRKDDLHPELRVYGVKKRWVAAIAVGVAVLAAGLAIVIWKAAQGPDPRKLSGEYAVATKEAMEKLVEKAQALKARHEAELKLLDLGSLRDYERIAKAEGPDAFAATIDRARAIIEATRTGMKDLFGGIYEMFPPEAVNERRDAQKLYGEIMTDVDVSEERLNADELVIGILLSGRDQWKVEKGQIVFSDPKLEREFLFFSKGADETVTRWRKDFGPKAKGVIESEIIEVPRNR